MYDANSQNTQLRLRTELGQCNYSPAMKDYLTNMIMQVMNYPKKTSQQQARHFIKTKNQDKIIMVWYPMSVPFMGKNYNVPLQIYFSKNIPYEPPEILLEVVQGSAVNEKNKDIEPNTNKIITNTLRNWGLYSNIDNVMKFMHLFATFSLFIKLNLIKILDIDLIKILDISRIKILDIDLIKILDIIQIKTNMEIIVELPVAEEFIMY